MDERDRDRFDKIDLANAARKLTRSEPMEWERRAQELLDAKLSGAIEERRRCVEIAHIIERDLPDEPSNGRLSAKSVVLNLIGLIEAG